MRRDACDEEQVLDRDRNAGEPALRLARGPVGSGLLRLGQRQLVHVGHDDVAERVGGFERADHLLDHVDRGEARPRHNP